jgi:hypothetical protein
MVGMAEKIGKRWSELEEKGADATLPVKVGKDFLRKKFRSGGMAWFEAI